MQPLRLDEDIRPLSEFRAGVAGFVRRVSETRRPLLLTQHGRGVAVLVDVREFEAMRERLALLEDVSAAEADIAAGRVTAARRGQGPPARGPRYVRLDWSDRALGRVRETARFIAADDPAAAVRWAEGLFDAVGRLADFPESGRLSPELEDRGVRELVYGAYRVFYRLDADAVLILTVRHSSQLVREDEVCEGRT